MQYATDLERDADLGALLILNLPTLCAPPDPMLSSRRFGGGTSFLGADVCAINAPTSVPGNIHEGDNQLFNSLCLTSTRHGRRKERHALYDSPTRPSGEHTVSS